MISITTFVLSFAGPPIKPPVTSFNYQGDLPPLNYFDPLQLNSEATFDERRTKWLREAELQHGRLAMLAAVALPLIELTNPDTLSIHYLSDMDASEQSVFWTSVLVYEISRMAIGWESPFKGKRGGDGSAFTLKSKYQPGNVLTVNPDVITKNTYDKELSNGRLAMLASAHIIGSELLTGNSLF